MAMKTRLVLVDDHRMFRENLSMRLEKENDIEIIGEANSGEEAIDIVKKVGPDVVIMDVSLDRAAVSGIEATREICLVDENIRVIALSMYEELVYVKQMLNAGASGYLLKDGSTKDLIKAIRTVMEGNTYFSEEINTALLQDYLDSIKHPGKKTKGIEEILSTREIEVLKMLVCEKSMKEIADELAISARTVGTHRLNIQKKLGIFTDAGLTKYALREGLITLDGC